MAYTFQNIYVGQSPYHAPALFSMIPAAELEEGAFFPEGGMYNLTDKLINISKEYGVRYHFNKPVIKLNVDGNKIRSVIFNGNSEAEADVIVANADLPYVYKELLPAGFKSWQPEQRNHSCSALVFHWGLSKQYPQLGHHNVFLSDKFREGLDKIFKEKSMGDSPSFYIHAPVKTDPKVAPEGCESLSVIVAAGHLDSKYPQDWEKLRKTAREAVVKRLHKLGITDIEANIKFEVFCSPADWKNAINISRGSVFGSLAHNIWQMGYFRPHNRHNRYKNLYFTGGSTHPGNGIPMVLLSAKLVSERILAGK